MTPKRLGLLVFALTIAGSASAQNLPVPAPTPVTCDAATLASFGGCSNFQGRTFPGWQGAPVLGFTGRWFDSAVSKSWQGGYRTSRGMAIRASDKRIYWVTLSAVMAYDPTNFVSALSTQVQENKLVGATGLGILGTIRTPPEDVVLRPDRFFNPEGSSWTTFILDGEQRVFDADWDDRGYVYIACGPFGWGIVKDDFGNGGGWMASSVQKLDATMDPSFIESIRSGNDYYLFVNGSGLSTQIWNATNPAAPTSAGTLAFAARRGSIAKSTDGSTIAVVYSDGTVRLYTAAAFVRGGDPAPFKVISAPAGGFFSSLTSDDHNNFFALSSGASGSSLNAIAMDGSGAYTLKATTNLGLSGNYRLQYGANMITGIGYESGIGWNVRFFTVNPNLTVGQLNDPNHFFASYYRTAGSSINEAVPFKVGTRTYVAIGTYALGDVYELQGVGNALSLVATPSSVTYGDPVTFSLSSAMSPKPSVSLEFGDGALAPLNPTPDYPTAPYTYGVRGNPLGSNASVAFTAFARTGDPAVAASALVTVNAPRKVGFMVQNHPEVTFTSPVASTTAAIGLADTFVDVSDGSALSHIVDWTIKDKSGALVAQNLGAAPGTAVKAAPDCGDFRLTYLTHYGPVASGAIAPANDAQYYLGAASSVGSTGYSVGYTVLPFSVSIQKDSSDSTGARILGSTQSTLGAGTVCSYEWDMLDVSGNILQQQKASTGCTLGVVPSFTADLTKTAAARVKLTITVDAASLTGATCKTLNSATTSMAYTPAPACPTFGSADYYVVYSGPTSGCTAVYGTCNPSESLTFAIRRATAGQPPCGPVDVMWNFGDGTSAQRKADLNNVNYAYNGSGTYSGSVTVTDGSGQTTGHSAVIPFTVKVGGSTPPPPPSGGDVCSIAPNSSNISIIYNGSDSGCTSSYGSCNTKDTISFSLITSGGYTLSCSPYTFTWHFGDTTPPTTSAASNGAVTHQYSGATASYNVTVDVVDKVGRSATITVFRPLPVAGGPNCAKPSTTNLSITTPACAASSAGCTDATPIPFSITANGFPFACPPYTYQWDFGDQTAVVTGDASQAGLARHKFAAGSYTVKATVTDVNGSSAVLSLPMKINTANLFGLAPCGPNTLCLNSANDQRYQVEVVAKDPNGKTGAGQAVGQQGPFGYFSFPVFAPPTDPQVFVKVLEPSPGRPWVFYAGLTNLDYTITVRDKIGSFNKAYPVPAPPFGSQQSIGGYDVNGQASQTCADVTVQKQIAAIPGSCTPDANSLCLLDRFRVTLQAVDNPARNNGLPKNAPGVTVPVNNKIFGFFTTPGLSSPDDIQAFIKMVDATSFNGHYWVMLGALTDFQLTFTVTDTKTGMQNIYTKPLVSTCGWNDNLAF